MQVQASYIHYAIQNTSFLGHIIRKVRYISRCLWEQWSKNPSPRYNITVCLTIYYVDISISQYSYRYIRLLKLKFANLIYS